MAITPLILLGMGALAAGISYLGLFARFGDNFTPVLLQATAAAIWGAFGMSAFNVEMSQRLCCSREAEILPLAYLGIGLALLMALFMISDLFTAIGDEARQTDQELEI